MKRILIGMMACAALAACGRVDPQEQKQWDDLQAGKAVLATTAPDGTKLWMALKVGGGLVYFSSRGTQTDERHGKTSETVMVPESD